MIRLSEHGLVMRQETNPIMRAMGAQTYIEPENRAGFTPAQVAIVKRIAAGESVDEADAGCELMGKP